MLFSGKSFGVMAARVCKFRTGCVWRSARDFGVLGSLMARLLNGFWARIEGFAVSGLLGHSLGGEI